MQPDYALELPSMEQISGWYPCVAQHAQDTCVGRDEVVSRKCKVKEGALNPEP